MPPKGASKKGGGAGATASAVHRYNLRDRKGQPKRNPERPPSPPPAPSPPAPPAPESPHSSSNRSTRYSDISSGFSSFSHYSGSPVPSSTSSANDSSCGWPGWGLSDTPPEHILGHRDANGYWDDHRENDASGTSRQLYIGEELLSYRVWNRVNFLTSVIVIAGWRLAYYPVRVYIRPAVLCTLALMVGAAITSWQSPDWWVELCDDENRRVCLTTIQYSSMAVWLVLHLFDLYRGLEFFLGNPPHNTTYWRGRVPRVLAILHPAGIVTMLIFSVLARRFANMNAGDWRQIMDKVFNESVCVSLVLGASEILLHWVAGFMAHSVIKCLMWVPTMAAVGFAVCWFGLYVSYSLERGWWLLPDIHGLSRAGS